MKLCVLLSARTFLSGDNMEDLTELYPDEIDPHWPEPNTLKSGKIPRPPEYTMLRFRKHGKLKTEVRMYNKETHVIQALEGLKPFITEHARYSWNPESACWEFEELVL